MWWYIFLGCLIQFTIKPCLKASKLHFESPRRKQFSKSYRCLLCAMSQHWQEKDSYATKGSLCPISLNKAGQVRLPFHSHILLNKTVMFCPCLLSTPLLLYGCLSSTPFLTFSYAEAAPPYSSLFLCPHQFSFSNSSCFCHFFPVQIGVQPGEPPTCPMWQQNRLQKNLIKYQIYVWIHMYM